MKVLEYPFNAKEIIKHKRSIRRELLKDESKEYIEKHIAILGGQTTSDIKIVLELFLLNQGIRPIFYESEYNQYYEDGMFDNKELELFSPDLIYVCTCIRNILEFPSLSDDKELVEKKRDAVVNKFRGLWDRLSEKYHCPIIQNNFEYPFFRIMGNKDASDYRGRVNFIMTVNCAFNEYAQVHENFYICDVNYISANYGLEKWSDPYYWHMYKYAVSVPAIPYLSFNVANIIKSIYGKNKKVLNLDLDNTLWGGVIGDDGVENIEIGQETPIAQTYSEFQTYLKDLKQLGVLLTVNSKNEANIAKKGFERPDSVLKNDDFIIFKANWNPKCNNLIETAGELALLPESFVFIDDNPAEREIVKSQVQTVSVPELSEAEHYIEIIDKSGFFEVTSFSNDDMKRNEMYQENLKRIQLQSTFTNYEDYLISLEMEAEIKSFSAIYMSRIAQLTNKSNQFNLTTRRYSQSEIEGIAQDNNYITLYGKLKDKFGDNGVVSIVIGEIDGNDSEQLNIILWLMSCRVLKRNMEYAMMDELVKTAKKKGIKKIIGYYYPTAKNSMVKEFYKDQGFELLSADTEGNTKWMLDVSEEYFDKQRVIEIICE